MYLYIALILGVVWLLGVIWGYTLGGGIHVLLAASLVMSCFGLREWWRRPA